MKFIVRKIFVIDPITILLGFMLFMLGFNYYSKYFSQPKNNNSSLKPLTVLKAKQVCVENEDLIECYPLDSELYKLILMKNDKDNTYNILISNK